MDIITLGLSKGYTNQVALGIGNMRVEGTDVIFTLAETGEEARVTLPTPADGVSIIDVQVDSNNHLICNLSNGSIIDAGKIKVSGGGQSATDDDILHLLDEMNIVNPISANDGKLYINNEGKIFIF